jgi:cell division protein ZapA
MSPEARAAQVANESIRVEIYDQAYNLRGTDPEHIARLAEYVDLKMRAVSEKTATADSLRVAVLAALNIADEYHLLRKKYDSIGRAYQERAQSLAGALDAAIAEKKTG